MADLTITASQVLKGTTAELLYGVGAATWTQGQVMYQNSAGKYDLADADNTQATSGAKMIALNSGSADQEVVGVRRGLITIGAGAAPTKGTIYVVSGTAGGIAPSADLAAGDWVVILGVANGSNQIDVDIVNPGIQV